MRSFLLALLLISASSCNKQRDPPPAKPPEPTPEPAHDLYVVDADQACTANADCALITKDCCGCQSGGSQVGVRRDRLAALGERRRPICQGMVCASFMSDDPSCTATRARCEMPTPAAPGAKGRCVPEGASKPTPAAGVEPIK
jgi:hypothetical protein